MVTGKLWAQRTRDAIRPEKPAPIITISFGFKICHLLNMAVKTFF